MRRATVLCLVAALAACVKEEPLTPEPTAPPPRPETPAAPGAAPAPMLSAAQQKQWKEAFAILTPETLAKLLEYERLMLPTMKLRLEIAREKDEALRQKKINQVASADASALTKTKLAAKEVIVLRPLANEWYGNRIALDRLTKQAAEAEKRVSGAKAAGLEPAAAAVALGNTLAQKRATAEAEVALWRKTFGEAKIAIFTKHEKDFADLEAKRAAVVEAPSGPPAAAQR